LVLVKDPGTRGPGGGFLTFLIPDDTKLIDTMKIAAFRSVKREQNNTEYNNITFPEKDRYSPRLELAKSGGQFPVG
jgi:hypothetical protein